MAFSILDPLRHSDPFLEKVRRQIVPIIALGFFGYVGDDRVYDRIGAHCVNVYHFKPEIDTLQIWVHEADVYSKEKDFTFHKCGQVTVVEPPTENESPLSSLSIRDLGNMTVEELEARGLEVTITQPKEPKVADWIEFGCKVKIEGTLGDDDVEITLS